MAAVDYFLKIEGMDGESLDSKHKGEIDILSYSVGGTQAADIGAGGGGGGAGKVSFHDFQVTMKTSKASPKLFLACANGDHIPKAVLVCRKAGKEQQEFLKITLSEVIVSHFTSGGHAAGDIIPVDQASLNFAKIEFEYKEQTSTGALGAATKMGWNLQENKKL